MKFVAALLLMSLMSGIASAATSSRSSYTDKYGSLSTDHNIFLRDRSHPATKPAATVTPSKQSDPEQTVVLRGVVYEENAYRAYIENTSSGEVKRLSVGDSVARGKAGEIDLNGFYYESPTTRAWIEIGADLTGQQAAPPPSLLEEISSSPTTAPTTMPANLAGLNPNDPTLSKEQQMKLRRLLESKGKQ